MKNVSTAVLMLLLASGIGAQDLPDMEDEQASDDYAEHLAFLRENPVNLNHAGLEQLMDLPGLTPYQVLRLDRYLKSHPGLSQPFQLEIDSVLSPAALEAILPYISLDAREGARPERFRVSQRLQRRRPDCPELTDGTYPGNPWEGRSRVWFRPSAGVEAFLQSQHDPGEPEWADYLSGSLTFKTGGGKKAVIGDYQVVVGHGLLLGGVSPKIFTSSGISFPGSAPDVTAYRSSQEARGLRGAGFSSPLPGGLSLLGFWSRRPQDARVDSLGVAQAFYDDGYHRSPAELARKNTSVETLAGGRVGWGRGSGPMVGLTYLSRSFDRAAANPYAPWMSGLDGGIALERLRLSAELAHGPGKLAGYGLGSLFISGNYSGRIYLYGYSPGFLTPRFNGENYFGGEDERGGSIFASWGRRRYNAAAIFGLFYPWQPMALSRQGFRGSRHETRLRARLLKCLEAELRIRSQAKEIHQSLPQEPLYQESKYSLRPGLRWQIGRGFEVNCRYENQTFKDSRDGARLRGELLAANFRARVRGGLWLAGQSTLYHIPEYRARIYLNEPELMSGGSFHGYWGRGAREALAIRYGRPGSFTAGLKVARQAKEYHGASTEAMELGFELEIMLK